MKAVVLAGGYATRLWPITKDRPKMLLPVGDHTVIDETFADLEADDRIDEVFVSTNERFADQFREYIAESSFEKPTLSVEDTSAEAEKFGVVGALAQLVDRENVDDDLLVVAGDNLISFDLAEFVDFFDRKGNTALAAYDVGSLQKAQSYGLVELDGDRVVDFEEKPDDPKSTLVSIACYAFDAADVRKFETYLEGGKNPDEPGWFIQWLHQRAPVHAFTFDGAWFDIGTAESYLDAVAWRLDEGTLVDESATVSNSDLGNTVQILADVTVENASLERCVIFPGATIRDAEVRTSIVDQGTRLEGFDVSGALIGAHTTLTDTSGFDD